MPDMPFEKSSHEGEKDMAAMLSIQEAFIKMLLDTLKGFKVEDPLKVKKTKFQGLGSDETLSADELTIETRDRKKEKSQAVPQELTIESRERSQSEALDLPPSKLIFGPGVDSMSIEDCKVLSSIVAGRRGDEIEGDFDYVIKLGGQVLYETTNGKITTHSGFDKSTGREGETMSEIISGRASADTLPHPKAAERVAAINAAIKDLVVDEVKSVGSAVQQRAENDIRTVAKGSLNLAQGIKDLITNTGVLDTPVADLYRSLRDQIQTSTRAGVVPETDIQIAESINKFVGAVDSMFDEITQDDERGFDLPADQLVADSRLEDALLFMAQRDDGATKMDGRGYNAKDTKLGQHVADKIIAGVPLTNNEARESLENLQKYKNTQLKPAGYFLPRWSDLSNQYSDQPEPQQEETPSTIAQEPPSLADANKRIAQFASKTGKAQRDDLKKVKALFEIFGRNTDDQQDFQTAKGREGSLPLPTGDVLINSIDDKNIANLSLVAGGAIHQLGAFDPATNTYQVGDDLKLAKSSLSALKRKVDPKTWTFKPVVQAQKPLTLADKARNEKPEYQTTQLFNIEADEVLIAKILIHPGALAVAKAEGISRNSFATMQHQDIFEVAESLSDRGITPNWHSVSLEMQDSQPQMPEQIAKIIGRDQSASMASLTAVVKEKQLRRELPSLGRLLQIDAYNLNYPTGKNIRAIHSEIGHIQSGVFKLQPPVPAIFNQKTLTDLQAEKQVIAAVLNTPSQEGRTLIGLLKTNGFTSDNMSDPIHQQIYEAAENLEAKNQEVNLITVRNWVTPEVAAKATDISEGTMVLPLNHDVPKLIDLSQRRNLDNLGEWLTEIAATPGLTLQDLQQALLKVDKSLEAVGASSPKIPEIQLEEQEPEKSPSKGR